MRLYLKTEKIWNNATTAEYKCMWIRPWMCWFTYIFQVTVLPFVDIQVSDGVVHYVDLQSQIQACEWTCACTTCTYTCFIFATKIWLQSEAEVTHSWPKSFLCEEVYKWNDLGSNVWGISYKNFPCEERKKRFKQRWGDSLDMGFLSLYSWDPMQKVCADPMCADKV